MIVNGVNMDDPELEPCWRCGSANVSYGCGYFGRDRAECDDCDASGDEGKNKSEAAAAWNRRAPVTAQKAARGLLNPNGSANERLCEIAEEIYGAGASMNRAIGEALRTIAEGRA